MSRKSRKSPLSLDKISSLRRNRGQKAEISNPFIINGLVADYDFSNPACLNGLIGKPGSSSAVVYDLARKASATTLASSQVGNNNLPLILKNGASYTSDKGGGIYLDGVGDGLWNNTVTSTTAELTNTFGITGASPSTFNCWIKFHSISNEGNIYMFIGNVGTSLSRIYFHRSGKLAVAYYFNDLTTSYTPIAGTIYMLTWTENGSGGGNLYVNGSLQQSFSLAAPNTASGGIIIGDGLLSSGYDPNINLYAFQWYNRVLTAQEVLLNYESTKKRFI